MSLPNTHTAPSSLNTEILRQRLIEIRASTEKNELANPIQILAIQLANEFNSDAYHNSDIDALTQDLTYNAFIARAARLSKYIGEAQVQANDKHLEAVIRTFTKGHTTMPSPFDEFNSKVGQLFYGFVITAHPTFASSEKLQHQLMEIATHSTSTANSSDAIGTMESILHDVRVTLHKPEYPLDLYVEHNRSLIALRNLLSAIRRLYRVIVRVAAETYPKQWRRIRPQIFSVASWVGYDTDGRSDISWRTSFSKRLLLQVVGLEHHLHNIQELRKTCEPEEPAEPLLELIEARLALALTAAQTEYEVFDDNGNQDAIEVLAKTARTMARTRPTRLNDGKELEGLISRCLEATRNDQLAASLVVMLAEVRGQGLSAARTHVRLNALQLHNAIRKQIGMDHPPDDPTRSMSYREAISRLLDDVQPVEINFGSVDAEKATAKRVFMIIVQMIKYLDSSEPIRFLIAETENAFTLLVALYFAKVFSVEKSVDISPLFETGTALERGVQILDEALSVPAYRHYIQKRKRLCFQTGFSDAGRYLGQTAASVAIERIRLDLVDVLARHKLTNIDVVIFDTHGESIGRGAHPASFSERLRYVNTPESRRRFAEAGIKVIQETSYQGGDGYLWFSTEQSAVAVVTRVIEHLFERPPVDAADPFYRESVYRNEFFAAVQRFNNNLIEHPDYSVLLGTYGSNLLYSTGSRPSKRQYDPGAHRHHLDHPSQIRAIPHNAILQQFGVLVNTIGGIGAASDKDPSRFFGLYKDSGRFRSLMGMVEHAFMFTDLSVTKAYLDRFDPGFWLMRAEVERDETAQEEFLVIADQMERLGRSESLARIYRIIQRDHMDLARALRTHRQHTRSIGEEPIAVDSSTRDNLHMIHALRISLIERIMRTASRIPEFSDRHEATYEDLLDAICELEIEPALRVLVQIFPILENGGARIEWDGTSSHDKEVEQSYAAEHESLFRPMARDYDLVRRLGSAIIHHVGAVG